MLRNRDKKALDVIGGWTAGGSLCAGQNGFDRYAMYALWIARKTYKSSHLSTYLVAQGIGRDLPS